MSEDCGGAIGLASQGGDGRRHGRPPARGLVHVWSTGHRTEWLATSSVCIVAQVADGILGKQARVENPDKDEVLR